MALCTLEKVAHTASDPISLYSCPPHSVFRVHVDGLNHRLPHPKKTVPIDSSSTQTTIRTISSADDIVVFIPPLRKQAKNGSLPPSKSSPSAAAVPMVPMYPPIDRPTGPDPVSNVYSFYQNAPAQNRHSRISILPFAAQAVQSPEGGKLDPLAIARSPPPWKIPGTSNHPAPPKPCAAIALHQGISLDHVKTSGRKQTITCWTGRALDDPLKVDRARLRKRGSDAVADMVHQFANKRLRVESEFALAKTRAAVSVKSYNPFARSVFAESSTKTSDNPPASVHGSSKETEPDRQLRVCRSLPLKTERQQGTDITGTLKPLRPITTLKPPILPKELLPSSSRQAPIHKTNLKQTRLSFSREGGGDGEANIDDV